MTEKSIETDEKPCPLTVSDWIALLAAESQAKFGYKHLVVAMLLAAFSMVLIAYTDGAIYTATRFGSSGDSGDHMQLIWGVVFCAMLAIFYRICHVKSLVNMFKDEDKNSEIIEEIIAGKLTDPDEIRKRWEKPHDSPEKAEELLKICEKQIETRWKMVKFLKLTGYSFVGNFKAIKEKIQFDILNESEAEKFIAVCENRRARARILMNEIAPVIGFDVIAMTVVATIVPKSNNVSGYELLKEILFAPLYGILLIFLFISFIFLFAMLAHYRVQVHAWTAFKEEAILRKHPAEEQAS